MLKGTGGVAIVLTYFIFNIYLAFGTDQIDTIMPLSALFLYNKLFPLHVIMHNQSLFQTKLSSALSKGIFVMFLWFKESSNDGLPISAMAFEHSIYYMHIECVSIRICGCDR